MEHVYSRMVRWSIYSCVSLCGMAGVLGRWVGPEFERRLIESHAPTPVLFDHARARPELVRFADHQSGRITSVTIEGGDKLQYASHAPWVDVWGHSQIVGHWTSHQGEGTNRIQVDSGLGRFSYPDGHALNRVQTDLIPVSPPCWLPDDSAAVIYPASNGELVRFRFENSTDPRAHNGCDLLPSALSSRTPQFDTRAVFVTDIAHAKAMGHPNLFVVALRLRSSSGSNLMSPPHIWWIELDGQAESIIDAGPITVLDPHAPTRGNAMRHPAVGRATDGSTYLAFLSRSHEQTDWTLRFAPLHSDPVTSRPQPLRAPADILADHCQGSPPTFAPGAKRLHYLSTSPDGAIVMADVDIPTSHTVP